MAATSHDLKFLLITANIGSIFEDRHGLQKTWTDEFLKTIQRLKPTFVALHCQEVGGKKYERTMKYVTEFVDTLVASPVLAADYHHHIFIDEDFTIEEKFTALGNFYFIHRQLASTVAIWNFEHQTFVPVEGDERHAGNIERVPIVAKLKYPQDFFPECKWSRKGFIRTRWLIDGLPLELVNIHLFHDESNFVAVTEFPTAYTKNRRKALSYTLDLIKKDAAASSLFIFGDFNFRLDTKGVIKKLINNVQPSNRRSSKGDVQRLTYNDLHHNQSLMVEKKKFIYSDDNFFSRLDTHQMLQQFDKELKYFEEDLAELSVDFPPSYPFEEGIDDTAATRYMATRCPGWCDRVLMDCSTFGVLSRDFPTVEYRLMGANVPMGDHKPVYLAFRLDVDKLKEAQASRQSPLSAANGLLNCETNDLLLSSHRRDVNDIDVEHSPSTSSSDNPKRSRNNNIISTPKEEGNEEAMPAAAAGAIIIEVPPQEPANKSSVPFFSFRRIKSYCSCYIM